MDARGEGQSTRMALKWKTQNVTRLIAYVNEESNLLPNWT